MTEFLLSALEIYGPIVLGLALLVASLGLPTPATPLVLAAGALARQGMVNFEAVLALAFVGIILGDMGSYTLGRYAGKRINGQTGRRGDLLKKAQDLLVKRGVLAIFLTRTALITLDVPTSIIAGSGRYPFARFLLSGAAGRALWLGVYAALGYAFSDQWQHINQMAGQYSLLLGGVVVAVIAGCFLIRRWRANITIRASV
jgi:membrane protein DedA with SNARE-associated domain